jgi:DNA repair protein RadC
MDPTADTQAVIDGETPRIGEAMLAQEEVLEPLIVFKGLHDETMDEFSARLREVFDNFVTHRRNTGIVVPNFPSGCSTT